MKNLKNCLKEKKRSLQRLGASQIDVYIQANNFALWTRFKGFDPESVGSRGEKNIPYVEQIAPLLDKAVTTLSRLDVLFGEADIKKKR